MSWIKLPNYLDNNIYPDNNILTKGNSKLGKSIYNFNLPPIESCPSCEDCKLTCYALKYYKRYKVVKDKYINNFKLVVNNLMRFEKQVQSEIDKKKIKVIRIHSSGDFFSLDYFKSWVNIARNNPSVVFFGYTKVEQIIKHIEKNPISNLNIIPSTLDGMLNYGKIDYIKKLRKKHKATICPVTLGYKITCDECKLCHFKDKVVFVQH